MRAPKEAAFDFSFYAPYKAAVETAFLSLCAARMQLEEEHTPFAVRSMTFRLKSPASIREKLLPAPAGDNYLAGSLLDTEWLEGLRTRHPDGHFIFVFEGVLMYFYEEQVRTVLRNIVSRFPAGGVCFDVCGPMMVNTGLKPDSLRRNAAQIRSGLADGHKVERWEPRLQLIEQRSYMEFARRRWGLTGIFFRAFPHLARKFSSLLAYRISATE